jgi:hypothetical protein
VKTGLCKTKLRVHKAVVDDSPAITLYECGRGSESVAKLHFCPKDSRSHESTAAPPLPTSHFINTFADVLADSVKVNKTHESLFKNSPFQNRLYQLRSP